MPNHEGDVYVKAIFEPSDGDSISLYFRCIEPTHDFSVYQGGGGMGYWEYWCNCAEDDEGSPRSCNDTAIHHPGVGPASHTSDGLCVWSNGAQGGQCQDATPHNPSCI